MTRILAAEEIYTKEGSPSAAGHTISKTSALTACSPGQVKRIWAIHLATQQKQAG